MEKQLTRIANKMIYLTAELISSHACNFPFLDFESLPIIMSFVKNKNKTLRYYLHLNDYSIYFCKFSTYSRTLRLLIITYLKNYFNLTLT